MTKNLLEKENLCVTSYYGGLNRGSCIQITAISTNDDNSCKTTYVQLDKQQCLDLWFAISEFLIPKTPKEK